MVGSGPLRIGAKSKWTASCGGSRNFDWHIDTGAARATPRPVQGQEQRHLPKPSDPTDYLEEAVRRDEKVRCNNSSAAELADKVKDVRDD